jgi:hypothetical protein
MANHPNRSKVTQVKVDVFGGPPGGYGFRKGFWPVTRDGLKLWVYASVPHSAELDTQARMVEQHAARAFAEYDAGQQSTSQWRLS